MNDLGKPPPEWEIDVHRAQRWISAGAVIADLRGGPERAIAHVSGDTVYQPSRHLPPSGRLILYCATGVRSLHEAQRLRAAGHAGVFSLRGGLQAWQAAGLASERAADLGAGGADRYLRQMLLPQIGPSGQARLSRSRVLLIGGGGLGAPAALYLAAAGIGAIGMVDDDQVELGNLHRQVLYGEADLGCDKVAVAGARLTALNPALSFTPYAFRLSAERLGDWFGEWDLVIDGSDNFATRYLVNDACLRFGLPLVSGAATAFEGQLSLFHPGAAPGRNPCYRCLYPRPPGDDAGAARDCASVGVLGSVPGLVAMLQATEAIKYLLGIGRPLIGRLLLIDALDSRFQELAFTAARGCVCRQAPTAPRNAGGTPPGA